MRIAHISDLHLLSLDGAVPFRLLNKRLTGYVNLQLRRNHVHKPEAVYAIGQELQQRKPDHLVITGDVSNLALEKEFELVQAFLQDKTGLAPEQISLVPGNHDAYTAGAHRSNRFVSYFGKYVQSDLPELSSGDVFPFVKLLDKVAIIGLSTALPRLPLVASGVVGKHQSEKLSLILNHPEVQSRFVVILQHHPIHNPQNRLKKFMDGLVDAHHLMDALDSLQEGLLLHGHLHRRVHRQMNTNRGVIDAIGATSASLVDDRDHKMAGFNWYEIGPTKNSYSSFRWNADRSGFEEVPMEKE